MFCRQSIDNRPAGNNCAMSGSLEGIFVKRGNRLVEGEDLQLLADPAMLREHAARKAVCLVTKMPAGAVSTDDIMTTRSNPWLSTGRSSSTAASALAFCEADPMIRRASSTFKTSHRSAGHPHRST
jgi:hypothetical protein